jgi:hypothetical protein
MRLGSGFTRKQKAKTTIHGDAGCGSFWRLAAGLPKKSWRARQGTACGNTSCWVRGWIRSPVGIPLPDHPETQAWKQKRLEDAGIAIPESLRFAPVDFERDTLEHGLEAVGFRPEEPAFFAWLGVVPYLTREAALSTLKFVAGLPPGSGVVFDYAIPREMLTEMERIAFDLLAERVARAGEPFRLFFRPDELEAELRAMGFTEIEDQDGAAIRARWLGGAAEESRPRRAGLLCARV